MATRSLRRLTLRALLGACAVLPGALASAEEPTPLERDLQPRYLDQTYLLQADVKVQQVATQTVRSSTVGPRPRIAETRPITVITSEGVFYTADYDKTDQINVDVRRGPGVSGFVGVDDPGWQNQNLVDGGTIGSVVEVEQSARVAIPKGYVVRVAGIEELPQGVRVHLEAFQGERIPVLVRGALKPADPVEARAREFDRLFGKLCYRVPEGKEARLQSIDPAWSDAVDAAIRESRVEVGMTPFQVVLSWGTPVFITRDEDGKVDIWLYRRGATIAEQMRGGVNVYFAAGRVADVEPADTP
ncbi:MAG: hypothetical protein PVF68_03185 [Acidobacteriota bacterium]|jgi:hypothetical protein